MFDAYVRRARFYPAVIAIAAAFPLAAILVPWNGVALPHAIASCAIVILLAVMSDIARRRGRAIEPGIVERMGGLPSTRMMRYSDQTFDGASKAAIHKFVGGKIGAKAPTPEGEQKNRAAADDFYKRCGNWLRENTRDTKKFKILFEENITYGFRRNLLGLKWPALIFDAAIVAVCAVMLWLRLPFNVADPPTEKLLLVLVIALVHVAYLLVFVNETGVVEAAQTYGRQLLLCAESLSTNARRTK